MLSASLTMAAKDLRLLILRGTSFVQAVLLGLLLVLLFGLAAGTGSRPGPATVAAVFWMASAICQVLIFNALYALEEGHGQRLGLLLTPAPVQSVWLGKALAAMVLLILMQLVFVAGAVILLNLDFGGGWPLALAAALAVDLGIVLAGSLVGPMAGGSAARDSLCSILLFPLLMPLFLAGIRTGAAALSPEAPADVFSWLALAVGFDLLFGCLGLVLFPFVFSAE